MTAGFPRAALAIEAGGRRHGFKIEMAVTPAQMAQGLMFREDLAADAGMLFDYRSPQPVWFWMRNTYLPLDMIFIREDGEIAGIHEGAVPLSEQPIHAPEPVRAVLEVMAGTCARLGIRAGDRVLHPIFDR